MSYLYHTTSVIPNESTLIVSRFDLSDPETAFVLQIGDLCEGVTVHLSLDTADRMISALSTVRAEMYEFEVNPPARRDDVTDTRDVAV